MPRRWASDSLREVSQEYVVANQADGDGKMGRFEQLSHRKARLSVAAAEQRQAIAETARALRRPLSWADRGVALLAYAKARPVLVAAVAAAVVAVKPARALALGRRAFSLWRGARMARALLALLQARLGGTA